MPESEPKPKLIELMAPGAGQGWKAVLKNGKAAVVHEIPVPQAEATAAVPRLQRLFDHRHPALSPVLAWGTDQSGIWVAVEPNEGTPLSSILSRGPMTPPSAAALGVAVLSGVAALHETGIAMGGFGATAVRVTSNGDVRLAGHPAAAVRGAPSQSDLRADVRSCGMAVCAAFGVDPAGAPAPANIPPGLVVTLRSMASAAMGPSANRAAFGGKPTEPPSCADLVRRPESGACGQRHDSPSAGACRRACPRTESERAGIRVATLATLVLDVPTGARPGRISRSAGAGRSAGAALPADVDADGAACCPVWAL